MIDYRGRLLEMAQRDRELRSELVSDGSLFGGYHPRMAALHDSHARTLSEMIDEIGWPGCSRVGADGAEAAWLILQHAIGMPEFQRRCLPLLQQAALDGEVPPSHAAFLEDRICVFEGRAQRFGTQFEWDGQGMLQPCLLASPEHVDRDRALMGLGPLADRIREVRYEADEAGDVQPEDFEAYLIARDAWARTVGWL